ncbi:type II toxin-antitoxin system HicB family antitoxin [Chloroflexota bacterium]
MNTRSVEEYIKLPYTIEIIREEDEENPGWVARVVELNGCITQADTFEELGEMIEDAMRVWIEVAQDDNLPIPEPRPEEDYSGKFVVRVPKTLHRRLVEAAQNEGTSLNQFVNYALASATSGSQPVEKLVKDENVTSLNKWPGLSEAAKNALHKAGLEEEAGMDDERLFSSWLSNLFAQIESCILLDDHPEAIRYIEHTTALLHQHMDRSPVLENIITILELQRQIIARNTQLQRALVRRVVIPDVQDRINELFQPSIMKETPILEEDISNISRLIESKQRFIKEARSKKLYWNDKRESHDE